MCCEWLASVPPVAAIYLSHRPLPSLTTYLDLSQPRGHRAASIFPIQLNSLFNCKNMPMAGNSKIQYLSLASVDVQYRTVWAQVYEDKSKRVSGGEGPGCNRVRRQWRGYRARI